MFSAENFASLSHKIRPLSRDVLFLAGIGNKVIDFQRRDFFTQFWTDSFVSPKNHGLHHRCFWIFKVRKSPLLSWLARKNGQHVLPIHFWICCSSGCTKGGQHIVSRHHVIRFRFWSDSARPSCHHRHANTALVEAHFPSPKLAIAGKEFSIHTSDPADSSVVAGEYEERIFLQSLALKFALNETNGMVQIGNHRGVGCARTRVWKISTGSQIMSLVPFSWKSINPLFWRLQGHVRQGGCIVQQKRRVALGRLNKLDASLCQLGGGIVLARISLGVIVLYGKRSRDFLVGGKHRIAQRLLSAVAIQVRGIVVVGSTLAEIAIEEVKSMVDRPFALFGTTQTPLAHQSRPIAKFA